MGSEIVHVPLELEVELVDVATPDAVDVEAEAALATFPLEESEIALAESLPTERQSWGCYRSDP